MIESKLSKISELEVDIGSIRAGEPDDGKMKSNID